MIAPPAGREEALEIAATDPVVDLWRLLGELYEEFLLILDSHGHEIAYKEVYVAVPEDPRDARWLCRLGELAGWETDLSPFYEDVQIHFMRETEPRGPPDWIQHHRALEETAKDRAKWLEETDWPSHHSV